MNCSKHRFVHEWNKWLWMSNWIIHLIDSFKNIDSLIIYSMICSKHWFIHERNKWLWVRHWIIRCVGLKVALRRAVYDIKVLWEPLESRRLRGTLMSYYQSNTQSSLKRFVQKRWIVLEWNTSPACCSIMANSAVASLILFPLNCAWEYYR